MAELHLDVLLEGTDDPAGRLSRLEDGSTAFRYLTDRLPHPISLSLPLREEPFRDADTRAFFSNLLFENPQREQVMQRHGLNHDDVVGLLEHLGGDCPGAICCVPEGSGPVRQPGDLSRDYDALGDQDLLEIMRSLRDHRRVPDAARDPSPLAGVQGKIALTHLPDGRFGLPRPGLNVPTSHILKVPQPAEMSLVEQEDMLMRIMAEVQPHPVAETRILGEGDLRGLLVTRFDRDIRAPWIGRLHQEDFAQALGLGPHLKYQRNGERPRLFDTHAIGGVLAQTENPGRARQAFLEVTLVNLLLGNTDNHAKNHALLYRGPRPEFAPVYDVAPVLADPQVTHQLAFDIGRALMTDEITAADLQLFVEALGYPRMTPALRRRMGTLVEKIVAMIPDMGGPRRKRLGDIIGEQAKALVRALALGDR